jgi:hypothetical protein
MRLSVRNDARQRQSRYHCNGPNHHHLRGGQLSGKLYRQGHRRTIQFADWLFRKSHARTGQRQFVRRASTPGATPPADMRESDAPHHCSAPLNILDQKLQNMELRWSI